MTQQIEKKQGWTNMKFETDCIIVDFENLLA